MHFLLLRESRGLVFRENYQSEVLKGSDVKSKTLRKPQSLDSAGGRAILLTCLTISHDLRVVPIVPVKLSGPCLLHCSSMAL